MDNKSLIWISVSKSNLATVWNKDDVVKLRQQHRIPGSLIGSLPRKPWQNQVMSLPLVLIAEEVTLLIKKGLAVLTREPGFQPIITEENIEQFKALREKSHLDQIRIFVSQRENKKRILDGRLNSVSTKDESKVDDVLENKSNALVNLDSENSERTQASESLKQKACKNSDKKYKNSQSIVLDSKKNEFFDLEDTDLKYYCKSTWVHLPTTPFKYITKEEQSKGLKFDVNWEFPKTDREKMNCSVYSDLWEKGYFLTTGEKFGCDYLAYPGEPSRYHSHFIVVVMSSSQKISAFELLTYGRLGTGVKKTVVFALVDAADSYSVKYQSLSWAGIE